jgi:hypothetical protein
MEPLIHRLLDADAGAAIELRPHLRHCIACRARLRAYSSAPRNVAALFPPSLVVLAHPHAGIFARAAEWCQALADRAAVQLLGANKWAEASGAKKVALIAAVTTATAGGGAAVHSAVDRDRSGRSDVAVEVRSAPAAHAGALVDPIARAQPAPRQARKHRRKKRRESSPVAQAQPVTPARPVETPAKAEVDDGSAEFLPEERSAP